MAFLNNALMILPLIVFNIPFDLIMKNTIFCTQKRHFFVLFWLFLTPKFSSNQDF